MSGPYIVPGLSIEVTIAMSNKTPVSSVRGAGYPQAAFAMERLLDRVAREMKLDRAEVRRRNLIPASKMPYRKPLKARSGMAMEYDSGDYPACQAEVLKAAGWDDFPKRQTEARAPKPPPTSGVITCTWSICKSSVAARSAWAREGAWVPSHAVKVPVSTFHCAQQARTSIVSATRRGECTSLRTR